ncbi:MAG TPA: phosphate ABC transporter substrate-binding protein PstS [Mycobacteriales bacterium]|nr:phosphate ABC transporter substrate-binding protein PstS [Mycobacteriales bacterium]
MKLHRFAAIPALLAAGTFVLAACGSDNDSGGGGSDNSSAPSNVSSGGKIDCPSGQLNAAGSSAQKPAFNAWITGFQGQCSSAQINYDATGSGAGITSFTQGQVPLAGSDSHLAPEEQGPADKRCAGGKAVDIPMVATPVAIVYNIKGVSDLTLTPDALAGIFSGKITKWNDPKIASANKGATLPATNITAVHRSKDSGTTDNFTKFLDAQDKQAWTYGTGKAWTAPGGIGAAESADMVSKVTGTDGAIGYVDSPDATKNKLTVAKLDVGSGPVALDTDSVNKGLDAAKVVQNGDDIEVQLNYGLNQAGAYPALLVTYEITCTSGLPTDQAKFVKSFLSYTSDAGQGELAKIGHFPLSDELITKVKASVAKLQG